MALCRHVGRCGGCQWQDVPYAEQLARKRSALHVVLNGSGVGGLPEISPVLPMPAGADGMPWTFRHKSAFVFGSGPRGALLLGHHAEGGRDVVPIEECPVQSARANRIAFALRDQLGQARVPAAGPSLEGVLRHLIVRTSADDRDAVALLVVTRNDARLRRPIQAFLRSTDRPDGFFLNLHPKPSAFMVGRDTIRIDGHARIRERVADTTFLVSPTAFFQTSPAAAQSLVHLVLTHIDHDARFVLDLYAGSGLFSLPLAKRGHRVTAVEENASAVTDAVKNLEVNRIDPRSVRFMASRVEHALDQLRRHTFDAVVLDPPRQGCAPAVIDAVCGRLGPPRLIYVSCNPAALAEELPAILGAGYRATHLQPVDMFPHTPHTEVVAVFDRRPSLGGRPQ